MGHEQVVLDFMDDVLNNHNPANAGKYLTEGMAWHGGTVGTVAGRDNVAGLMGAVVGAIPDLHAELQDMAVQDDKVVVRLVVTGTLQGDLLGVTGTGQAVRWDAIDYYRLEDGLIAEEWAGEDFTAFLNTSGAYRAPWIQ
ncbi:ester cyclase [Diaminobutyricibacter tongyongensis]|uniref:Ester cyclase n=1 Tax=Leifsonia tongyongensis TaxID=1268043 RepID=A0A6L9Y2G0_9MICO|nr:ester cyclase [Diaminobutyricibacter tongyongensis]NEN07597.1 ester cyclase [Diaminobutyricibacter tongyongensis]